MKIRPTLRYHHFLPASVVMLSGLTAPGCDQKLGGDVPVTPEMQEQWQKERQKQELQVQQSQEAVLPAADDLQQLGGEVIKEPALPKISPDDSPAEQ